MTLAPQLVLSATVSTSVMSQSRTRESMITMARCTLVTYVATWSKGLFGF